MKSLSCVAMALFAGALLFASGTKESASTSSVSDGKIKIGLIVESTIDDKGWCQAMHDGIMQANKELGGIIEYNYTEKMKPVDAGSAIRKYISQGYKIIIAHGAQYKNIVLETAEEYPDISFAFGTSGEIGPKNVFTYMPESEETGYLSGIIAGLTTKVKILGVVGPVDGGDAARYNRGFVLGAKKVCPDVKILVAHTGSFSDVVKAGEIAQSQIASGADVLSGSAQQSLGALRAVAEYKDKNVFWVGQDTAQLTISEGYKCIAASSYVYSAVIKGIIEKQKAGITGGECIPMDFNNGGFIFEFNNDSSLYTAEVKSAVESAIKDLQKAAGTIDWQSVDYSKL